jgi:hypothetical protein
MISISGDYNMLKSLVLFAFGALLLSAPAKSDSDQQLPERAKGKFNSSSTLQRVGGNYSVKEIKMKKSGTTVVIFEAEVKNGRADYIVLETDHIHVGIEEGQVLRLSAEVEWKSESEGVKVKADQVLLFIPRQGGAVPVWLLSKKGRRKNLRGSSYLKMHNPQSDFVIL